MVVQVLLQPHMMSRLNVCCQVCNLLEVPIAKAIKDQPTQDDQLSKSPRRKKQQMSEQRKEVRAATTLQLSQLLNNMPNSGSTASDAGSA